MLARYAPTSSPESIAADIEKAIAGDMTGVVTPTNPVDAAKKALKFW